jgi:hypothetical protein
VHRSLTALIVIFFGAQIAVGPTPPAPSEQSARCAVGPVRYATYGAQIVNAFVVSNAVHQGSRGGTVFGGTSSSSYLAELAAEDAIAGMLTRHASCGTKVLVNGVLGASAIINAVNTKFP